jgi:hypothetical protein
MQEPKRPSDGPAAWVTARPFREPVPTADTRWSSWRFHPILRVNQPSDPSLRFRIVVSRRGSPRFRLRRQL